MTRYKNIPLNQDRCWDIRSILQVAAAYLLAGAVGLLLERPPGCDAMPWPPAGLALAAAWLRSKSAFPGIGLGAFVLNLWLYIGDGAYAWAPAVAISASLALGATLQAVLSAWMIGRTTGIPNTRWYMNKTAMFLFCGAPCGCLVNACWATATLSWAGAIPAESIGLTWWSAWVGDLLGVLMLAPAVAMSRISPSARQEFIAGERAEEHNNTQTQFSALGNTATKTAFIATDASGIVTRFNTGAEHMFGYTASEMIGRLSLMHLHEPGELDEYAAKLSKSLNKPMLGFQAIVENAVRNGGDEREWTCVRKDGSRIAVRSLMTVQRNSQNEITGYSACAQDITESVRANERFRVLFEQSSDAHLMFDVAAGIVDCNQATLNMLRCPDKRYAVGRQPSEISPEFQPNGRASVEMAREICELTRVKGQHRFDWVYRRYSGEDFTCEVSLTVVTLEGREVFLASWHDLTERHRSQQELVESERRLRISLDNAGQGFWDWNLRDGEIELDDQWLAILGYGPGELPSRVKAWEKTIHPDDIERVRQTLYRHLADDDAPYDVDYRARHKSGEWIWVNSRGRVHTRDLGGQALRMIGTIQDITSRKQSEERFRQVVEAAPYGMIMINRFGQIVLVNPKAETMFGYTRDALMFRPVETLISLRLIDFDAHYRQSTLNGFDASAPPTSGEFVGVRSNGSEFPVEVGLNVIRTDAGAFMLASIMDLTARKLAEQASVEHARELSRSNAELEQFAYVASHDLREPLRMVHSFCLLLQDRCRGQLDDKANKYIDFAVDGAKRMQQLVDDLLEYSRVGRSSETRVPVELTEVVQRARENLTAIFLETNAQLEVGPLPRVQGDPIRLCQLFQNLMGNAVKFRGAKPPCVSIFAELDGDQWRISVKDNGIGIGRQYFERIFVVFQRLHTSEEYPGTGVGLALCKRIVELHGGKIWLESEEGEGTEFFFTLPAVRLNNLPLLESPPCDTMLQPT